MARSPETRVVIDDVEEIPLNTIAGTGNNTTNNNVQACSCKTGRRLDDASCCNDKFHRKLAICSIICGISCIGILALKNSVKAKASSDPERSKEFLRRAKKYGIISIVTWVSILASIPILMALISYLVTLKN
ncbi:transmembrane protein 265-like [Sphaeramia orbicularis]|uniref:transmembrane protein 265-like n=1 Tax=Sphaeramia orbicularis TaxID=375764 RepID=UPI00117BF829|nr:transmembrane protein 265 [Sphaeramia orbicularis]